MGKLREIDKKAEEKGKGLTTLWQFVKFIVVSLLAFVVQFTLLNTLKFIPAIKDLYSVDFNWWIFSCEIAAGGTGYFIVNNVANIVAQIVSFFVNRDKTFNSSANIAITLPIYIIFTLGLIVFSAWFNPVFKDFLVVKGLGDTVASNASTMLCCAIQFFLYFPVDKLLFKKKQ